MEVFLFVSSEDEMKLLEMTMLAWEQIDYAFPVNVVQLPAYRFELKRRVLADEMAKDSHYVLADLGCVPEESRALLGIVGKMKSSDGLIGFWRSGTDFDSDKAVAPAGIRVCRKGIVQKWPAQNSPRYDEEHAAAVKAVGYQVSIWPTTYKQILAC